MQHIPEPPGQAAGPAAAPPAERPAAKPADKPVGRPKVKVRGYLPAHQLSQQQVDNLHTIVETYGPDLHDPAAVEVLLVLLEVCHILDVPEPRMGQIFGERRLHGLETWGDIVPPKRRPPKLRRAWVWAPNSYQPKLYPIEEDGTICMYAKEPDEQPAGQPAGQPAEEPAEEQEQ
jgi:hypothetical protein